ncbi:centrosomal protein kizuna isoform X2 [Betta splendens]|uniref:Centrosomal protein kizuna n=1 Tax=Betta splendens TaxID=158456 RepID=A0A8M1H9G7_BETSP|nr:centrosomal protein kizuna isoform X2 [Betta splendens]
MATKVNTGLPPSPALALGCSAAPRRVKMADMAGSLDLYYKKITSIQQSIHKSEKRRLELERELFAYSRCDRRMEARAKMRNLELLTDVECMEISMKEYSPDHGALLQQKAEFLKKISQFNDARKKMEQDTDEATHRQQQDSSPCHQPGHFTQPLGENFTDHQNSRGSDTEAGSTSVHSDQALHHSSNRSIHSGERLPSGLLKDFRAGGEDAARNRAHLSDDISGSNDSPDGCNLCDKHERTTPVLPSVWALTGTAHNVPFGSDDEREPSPPVTLMGLKKNLSGGSSGPRRVKNSPGEHSDVAHQPSMMEDEGRGLSYVMPQATFGKGDEGVPGRRESVSTPSSDVELSESTASNLSISLTQSELEEDLPQGVAPEWNASPGGNDIHNQHSPQSSIHSHCSKDTSPVILESLSQEGLFNLLDSIEGRLYGERISVYEDSSVDGRQLDRIISLCNSGASLNGENLETCGAVVLHELQRLSWSTAKGCLLPQDLVSTHRSNTEPKISTALPPDAARLWDRWFKHALLLKERHVLSTERLVQLFTPLLLERHATYGHQAKVLLRTLLSRSSEECPSAEDGSDFSSAAGPPSLLAGGDWKQAGPVQKQQIQELQSTEEDSQDESPVESVPIRESKAYQLLKQSAMQERLQSSEEEEEDDDSLSGINHGHEEDLGRAKCSSHQDPYPRKETPRSKTHSALQSKAFWGESDDSNSEIEAALRPQLFNSNTHDADDFMD